jgi:hypothetical protein
LFTSFQAFNCLKSTRDDVLALSCDDTHNVIWHIDAAFGAHSDLKSHTGATMSLGEGALQSISPKQKVNTRSSTEAGLISIDDVISKIIWTELFLDQQGYEVNQNILKEIT